MRASKQLHTYSFVSELVACLLASARGLAEAAAYNWVRSTLSRASQLVSAVAGLLADDEPGHESLLAGGPSPSAEALAGIAQVSADDLGLDDVRRRRLSAYPGA